MGGRLVSDLIRGEFDTADAERRLRGLAAQVVDLRPFWPIVRRLVRGWFRSHFESEGLWGGDYWQPLSVDYWSWKESVRPGRPILVFDGKLRRAVFAPHMDAGPDYADFTVRDPKAEWHQFGTPRMPARSVVPPRLPAIAQHELQIEADRYFSTLSRTWGFG